MQIATPLSGELTQYLDLSSAELKLTAQNMANLDTPGYRTQGFDFAAEMQRDVYKRQHILLRSISSLSGRFGADFVEGTC